MTFDDLLKIVCYAPHPEVRVGKIGFAPEVFENDGTINCVISPGARIDCTGDVVIGPHCMIGEGTRILTHDHYHDGREPLLIQQRERGVRVENKWIGTDVWLHGCIVLCQVKRIPDGVVIGAGAVLTKNPGAYEIWAGNPAVKVGER